MLLGSVGCVTPFNTKTPQVVHRPAEMERREAQVHDPYPDATFGPDTGFRPLGYTEQRSEPQRAKDRFYTSMLRSQNSNPHAPQTMNAPIGRPQVTNNPHLNGTQQVYGAPQYVTPTAYIGNGHPQPMMPNGVAPVAVPAYYPPNYR
jgi:hypothetical protein